ncbi:MAG: TlyA family RNA methyltransferase [Kiritimatiellae bacterium]|nr:TlyA family RNA methyltransferase [Kiritimatiellia bacterium]
MVVQGKKSAGKERLDVLVASRGLAESREQAQRLIMAGQVLVNGQVAAKSGHRYCEDVDLAVKAGSRFVGRGGDKLEAAFECFGLDVNGLICLDVGASTGGFTDCMLQHGAAKVFAVDVGKGQLHWKLHNDTRVEVMDNVNARYLEPDKFSQRPLFAAVDVAFISLTKVLPALVRVLGDGAEMVTLIKPQFEAERGDVGKGGIVRDEKIRLQVIERVKEFGVKELGFEWLGICESPVRKLTGNVEFLAYWRA